jgi:hypothetical protein
MSLDELDRPHVSPAARHVSVAADVLELEAGLRKAMNLVSRR